MRAGLVLILTLLVGCDRPPMPQTEEGAHRPPAAEVPTQGGQGVTEER
jgi:hypothetical protein